MSTYAYIRVSTAEQNADRQFAAMENFCKTRNIQDCKIVSEKISGKKSAKDRKLQSILDDKNLTHLLINSITRLGRRNVEIVNNIDSLKNRGVNITIVRLGLSSLLDNGKKNPAFGMVAAIMGQLAEDEVEMKEERQKEGIAIAKANGVYKGRAIGATKSTDKLLTENKAVVKELKRENPLSLRKIAAIANCSVNTVQKVKRAMLEIA